MEHHPTLAKDFNLLRQELDSPFSSAAILTESSHMMSINERLSVQQSTVQRRNKAAQDLDNIFQQVRQKPGFENFLRAESEAYLLSAAQEGPIVVLNVTELRSDAILVTELGVRSIPLLHLSHASVGKYCNTCLCPAHDTRDDNEVKRELLEWLWRVAVQPVLREFGFYPKKVDPLPWIWWIGVGAMAKAPIHAAAKFKNGKVQMTTLEYCVPSYTSTIR